ncbi:hypothetical protein [Photobacterium salinisoli]|uniref:hypothetical protein n=1 Tax=Photobacterium salinisoli TaxID=1616783 RepID=UPI000EA06D8B|nr:hypothetical protein [Photobacterium salinisoli]
MNFNLRIQPLYVGRIAGLGIAAVFSSSLMANDWTYSAEIYGLGASVDIKSARGLSTSADFDEIADKLEFALFGSLAAKRDRLALIANILYVNLNDSKVNTRDSVTRRVETDLKAVVSTLAAGWEFNRSDTYVIHGVLGARLLLLDTDLTAEVDSLGASNVNESTDVWDAVIGVQGRAELSNQWYLSYYADIGTGDSDLTWQAATLVGYRFENLDVTFGYQYLKWQLDEMVLDELEIAGPALGLRFHW